MAETKKQAQNPWVRARKLMLRYGTELVVIFLGITLGFLFDEWRQERQERREEAQLLRVVKAELELKEAELATDSVFMVANNRLADGIRGYLKGEADTLVFYLSAEEEEAFTQGLAYGLANFHRIDGHFEHKSSTLEYLNNSGGWRLIENEQLARDLVSLFDGLKGITHEYERYRTLSVKLREMCPNTFGGLQRARADARQCEPLLAELGAFRWHENLMLFLQSGGLASIRAMLERVEQRLEELTGEASE